jgi:hypothetical protein
MTETLGKGTLFSLFALSTVALACDATSSTASASDASTFSGSDGTEGGDATGGTGSVEISAENMIDDLEDGDDAIIEQGERGGSWFSYNDETEGATQTPSPDGSFSASEGGPEGSSFYAGSTGSGFTVWGAGIGFDFQNDGVTKAPYDASAFSGIAFSAKGTVSMRVNLMTDATLDETLGGSCVPEGGENGDCGDGHGLDIVLTDTWTQYLVPFDGVSQVGWGVSADFNAAEVVAMHFQVAQGPDFDIQIDNIGLYE